MNLIASLSRHLISGKLEELTLTTNGSQLSKYAQQLADHGVKRLNVSIDTLDREKFKTITRWGDLDQVLAGLNAAKSAGLNIKINTVALNGTNNDELKDMLTWAGDNGYDMTIIEVMPMGDIGSETRIDQYLPLNAVRNNLSKYFTLEDIDYKTGGPARYTRVRETGGRLGFITPLTHNFCESCNRVRVTCTGTLYMCLGQDDDADLKTPLRNSEGDEAVIRAIREAILRKPKGHDFIIDRNTAVEPVTRHMSVTGG
tara:strand:- start:716 stop:1486 length:771 start_codon:yes stop_codon:yes gene_type:complete